MYDILAIFYYINLVLEKIVPRIKNIKSHWEL